MPRRPLDTHADDQRSRSEAVGPGRVIDLTTTTNDEDAVPDAAAPPPTDDPHDDGFVPL